MALIGVDQVREILGIPESTAYRIIRDLNKELSSQGFYVIRGKCEKNYLLERFRIPQEEAGVRDEPQNRDQHGK